MGIKGLKIPMIVSISFDTEAMPCLNPQQSEQAIGRLYAGQPSRVIANDFNCNVQTIERLQVRYNATNSTNDRPCCGRPQVTTARQNRLMVRQHSRNRSTRATETARQTVGTHQRPISADTIRHRLVASNLRCYRPASGPVLTPRHRQERLQWAFQRQNWRNQQSGVTSSSLTKAVTASQPQMAELDFGEGEEIDMMTTA
jgi:hypothetical protein